MVFDFGVVPVVTALTAWPNPVFLGAAAVAFLVLVACAVVYTSTLRRRPGRPPDPAQGVPRAVHAPDDPRSAFQAGQADAEEFPFTSAEEVLLALEEICLGRSRLYEEGAEHVVEFRQTASSRAAGRTEQRECAYETGFLEAGLRAVTGGEVSVTEEKCRSQGGKVCVFRVRNAVFPETPERRLSQKKGGSPTPWSQGTGS